MQKIARIALSVTSSVSLAASCAAQFLCPGNNWQSGDGLAGVDGDVKAVVSWDSDGAGPLPPVLVAGGQFQSAGQLATLNVAVWNGTTWSPLGAGLDGPVTSLAVYNNQLIAGGSFLHSGGASVASIAVWTGSQWESLGGGTDDFVSALTVWNGQLVAGGGFFSAGGIPAAHIARWDGTNWAACGSGTNDSVESLCDFQGSLVAGGSFGIAGGGTAKCVARWNGSTWTAFGGGMNSTVRALAIYADQLYAGGSFTGADSNPVKGFARWTGSTWQSVAPIASDNVTQINALIVRNSELCVAGEMSKIGGVNVSNIASWNGVAWKAMGAGTNNPIYALGVHLNELVVCGSFSASALSFAFAQQTVNTSRIARWDGTYWHPVGGGFANGTGPANIRATAIYNNELIVGGEFSSAPGVAANNIARWDGTRWYPLGNGVQFGALSDGGVYALGQFQGDLYVGGIFSGAGSSTATKNIARWDGSAWHDMGTGANGVVYAFTIYKNSLYTGGAFSTMDGVTANRLARWSGSGWFDADSGNTEFLSAVQALAVFNNLLFAGGSFSTFGGVSSPNIAAWNGSTWSGTGGGLYGSSHAQVEALAVFGGELVAAGKFYNSAFGGLGSIARWNGSRWAAIGTGGTDIAEDVTSLLSVSDSADGNHLIVAGTFTDITGYPANRIASWNGANWQAFSTGLSGRVNTLAAFPPNQLIVGGKFQTAGGLASPALARWKCACPTDFNGDGFVTGDDYDLYVEAFTAGETSADFNNDGFVTGDDFDAFVLAFEAGC